MPVTRNPPDGGTSRVARAPRPGPRSRAPNGRSARPPATETSPETKKADRADARSPRERRTRRAVPKAPCSRRSSTVTPRGPSIAKRSPSAATIGSAAAGEGSRGARRRRRGIDRVPSRSAPRRSPRGSRRFRSSGPRNRGCPPARAASRSCTLTPPFRAAARARAADSSVRPAAAARKRRGRRARMRPRRSSPPDSEPPPPIEISSAVRRGRSPGSPSFGSFPTRTCTSATEGGSRRRSTVSKSTGTPSASDRRACETPWSRLWNRSDFQTE